MGVIGVVCAAFGLTVSEAKTEIICLRAKGMPESTATFSVEAAGQVYTSGETSTTTPTDPSRPTGAYATHGALPEVHPRTLRPTERSPRARNPDVKSRGTRDDTVRLRHVEPARVSL